ncbi:formate--tetrahydrofolate ligase [Flavobacterium sp.]|uniref:formate--tetrahydrofolate ligase n=1 Tax=Flavobacterium sp. TaxID=239 RepID=UPI002FDA918A
MLTDIQIAQQAKLVPIGQVAQKLAIPSEDLELYGKYKAKLPLHLINKEQITQSKLILVTAMTPTPVGEGKTTISVGLADGLAKLNKKVVAVLREPSLGPVFGMKGGAAGGGYAQVVPMEDINLHFTGDFAAVEKANNLLSALIDSNLQSKSRSLNLDPRTLTWKRVVDLNDRALRKIVIGLGGSANGIPREEGFSITPASEIMAILCLSESIADLKNRLASIYIGNTFSGEPIFAKDLNAVGAMAVLLKEAIKPNLVQTLEGNPAILHGGPFASIAQGTNSVLATKMGLSLADYVVTEAGFGADLGAEKFFNIKCVSSGLQPKAVILVATIRALRHHGGVSSSEYDIPALDKVTLGIKNLHKHIENCKTFGYTPIVALNYFPNDSSEEIEYVREYFKNIGIKMVVAQGFAEGGTGMIPLAQSVLEHLEESNETLKPLYESDWSTQEKIETIAFKIYGANTVLYTEKAKNQLKLIEKLGFSKLPVCIAKTPKSFSDNPNLIGVPEHFTVTVREFEWATGAGFLIPIMGDVMRMPGLPLYPAAEHIDLTDEGLVIGLS